MLHTDRTLLDCQGAPQAKSNVRRAVQLPAIPGKTQTSSRRSLAWVTVSLLDLVHASVSHDGFQNINLLLADGLQ